MNLFEDDNKNEAAPAQEPVSAKPAEKPKPTVTPAAKASKKGSVPAEGEMTP
ncbi:hypothetical protein [Enterobacter sichuanensis]|uniref:hypothetical protein n=1 Tax=Enterobacter sichuanensis TaxID=2071710 RepID=UPI000B07D1CB|nr:hypothetical protein [Enterobacter sichuanensis]